MPFTEIQPNDYDDVLPAAIGSWWYFLTFLLPAIVYVVPAIARWRYIVWLVPVAFIASCLGYFVYWLSIDYVLMDYYRKTGYLNTVDTWYVFMPIFRGIPNALVATAGCTFIGWAISRRGLFEPQNESQDRVHETKPPGYTSSDNPYEPPHSQSGG